MEGGTGMRHYLESEWIAFGEKTVSQPESEMMESHLLECDQCINAFLEIKHIHANTQLYNNIPPDFSQRTMEFIKKNQLKKFIPSHRRGKTGRLLSYYVAAAAVTLMLMSQGAFQIIPGNVDRISASSAIMAEKTDKIIYTWPNRLLERSSNWKSLLTTESIILKEVIR